MDEIELSDLEHQAEQIVRTIQKPAVIISNDQPVAVLMSCECFDILAEALLIVDDLEQAADQIVRVCEV